MAAAYAAVVSLMNTLENIKNHPRHKFSIGKKQMKSLGKKLCFLEEFLDNYSYIGGSSEIEALETQIAYKAHAAEDRIETHIVDQIHAGSVSLLDIRKVIKDMNSLKEKVGKFQEKRASQDVRTTFSTPLNISIEKSKMVGCREELIQLMDVLTRQQSSRQIVPIVGMGGIGKTTLARNAYENLVIVENFDIRLWVTVSQEYSLREILLKLLSRQTNSPSGLDEEINYELGEQLYKMLFGRRYLIVLDDMWSIEAWDGIKKFVPDNNNGSRIAVTTRESNLAIHLSSTPLSKKFLDEDASWNLFCEKAFAEEGCPPPELEAIGKRIVEKCKGLPLSVSVIGGLLGKSTMTPEYWENIAKDLNSVLINSGEEKDERCLNILSLSYRHLPAHLKPCLLYMGIFPEDFEIRVSKLIKLWVAEGFLKPNEARILEEVAEGHFTELVDRNLILVRELGSTGNIKTCSIHDVIRELCMRVAEKEGFLYVMRSQYDIPRGIDMVRRIVIPERIGNLVSGVLQHATLLARSLLCCDVNMTLSSGLKLLRVSNEFGYREESYSPNNDFQYVNLRYLARSFSHHSEGPYTLPSSVFTLWNMQTLILRPIQYVYTSKRFGTIYAPSEIWNMTQIRHLVFGAVYLPDPPSHQQDGRCIILRNLQTLGIVMDFKLSAEICKIIPNLKKLELEYDYGFPASNYDLSNLGRFRKLESLYLSSFSKLNLKFPNSLKKLYLQRCKLHSEELTMIGSLPHLEALKLGGRSVIGPEWSPAEGEFLRLKYLHLYGLRDDLICWNADRWHFPILENLIIELVSDEFEGIPSGIGDIPTLRVIKVIWCSERVAMSAVRILEEQVSLGNEGLQVEIELWGEETESFREMIEEELDSFTSNNLQLRATLP